MTYKIAGGVLGGKALSLSQFDDFLDWVASDRGGNEPQDLYKAVAWAFWCANLRADSIAQVPYAIYRRDTDEDTPENEVTAWDIDLTEMLWLVEMWLCLKGQAFALKRAAGGMLRDMRVLNANSMRVLEYDNDGPTVFRQQVGTQHVDYPADEIVYFRAFSPSDDINAGTSSGQVATEANKLIKHANLWASGFFENGAIPAVILEVEGAITKGDRNEAKTAWKRMVGGIRNVWEVMVLGRGAKVHTISPPVSDLAMPDLEKTKRQQILAAHKIPPGLAEPKTNRAERDALQWEFWNHCVLPEIQVWLQPAINRQLLDPMGLRIGFHFNEIEAIQREEIAKAEAMAFAINGVALPAYEANVMAVDEVRAWIDHVGRAASFPALDETFEPEERTPLQLMAPQEGGEGEDDGPGASVGENVGENAEAGTRPKALAPQWGARRVFLPN